MSNIIDPITARRWLAEQWAALVAGGGEKKTLQVPTPSDKGLNETVLHRRILHRGRSCLSGHD